MKHLLKKSNICKDKISLFHLIIISIIRLYTAETQDAVAFYQLNDQLNFKASLNLLTNIGESVSKISNDL